MRILFKRFCTGFVPKAEDLGTETCTETAVCLGTADCDAAAIDVQKTTVMDYASQRRER